MENTPEADPAPEPQSDRLPVRDLALALFDCTRRFHALDPNHRRVLDWAARLVPPIPVKGKKKALQAARELVQSEVTEELSSEEQDLLAVLIAFREDQFKNGDLSTFQFSAATRRELLALAAMLHISAGLALPDDPDLAITGVRVVPPGLWLIIEGEQAEEAAASANQKSGLWKKAGFPSLKVLEASRADSQSQQYPSLPQRAKNAGVTASDPMAEAGRKVMRFHFAEMLANEEGTRLGEDIEALHDMRVATRRMRAAFDVFGDAFEPDALKPHLKGLRLTGRALGKVRDLDVFMEKAQAFIQDLPKKDRHGLDLLLQGWGSQRDQARLEMLAHLNSPAYHKFVWEFNDFLSSPGAGARPVTSDQPAPSLVREIAPILIFSRLAGVRAYEPFLKDASLERMHALRIEFKKLRYSVEFFREVLGEEAREVISGLKMMQDHLGDLNDADIATQILRTFLDEWEAQQPGLPVSERQNPQLIVDYLASRHSERHRLMVSFNQAWEKFNQPEFRRNLALAISAL